MEGIRQDSVCARRFVGALGNERFALVDVGCSGGLDPGWRVFGDGLTAWGFDPAGPEILRLTAAETRPHVRYIEALVGLPDGHPLKGACKEPWLKDPWARLSARRTQELQAARTAAAAPPAESSSPEPSELSPPPRRVHLPDFLADEGVTDLDFIKIDVDGEDFEVLRSLDRTLDELGVIGAVLEVAYVGGADEHAHSFHNTDRYMRARGFDLFGLTVRPYSAAVMPFPFRYPHPHGSVATGGRPYLGDALYLRDLGASPNAAAGVSDVKLVKLAALFALFGLPDHAAQLLVTHAERLRPHLDIEAALDALAEEIQDLEPELHEGQPRFSGYAEYLAAYEADHPYFYAADDRRHAARMRPVLERDDLHRRLVAAQAELHDLRSAVAQIEVEAMGRVEALFHNSLSWRLTAPLRALGRIRRVSAAKLPFAHPFPWCRTAGDRGAGASRGRGSSS